MKLWMLPLMMVGLADAARILAFFPIAGKSHHYVFRPIMEALGRRGHEVVYYTAYPYERAVPQGIVQVDLSGELPNFHTAVNVLDLIDASVIDNMKQLFEIGITMTPYILGSSIVQQLIHSDENFDVVLSESYVIQEYVSAFIHKFNAIGIDIMSLGDSGWMNELAGLPNNPSYQIDFKAELTHDMNFWQRVYNTYVNSVATLGGYYYMKQVERYVDQYFNYTGHESRPPFMQLLSNRSLILVNYHHVVGYPSPKPPHRKDIGGVTISPRKPLPKNVQTFMDGGETGVIYFALGSNVNVSHSTNRRLVETIVKVFEEVPQKVLMKWETEKYEGKLPKNIYLEKWYPQQDVLAHNNTVLFITHGGYLSLVEAVHFGVPLICIPFFVDQAKNCRFVEEAGIGKMLRLNKINYDDASRTIKEVLQSKAYKTEMTRRSKIFRDKPVEPLDEAVFWIEHVIKYPDVLKPKSTSLSFIQLHLIDVSLFVMTVLSVSVFILLNSIKILIRILISKSKANKEKKT